MLKNPDSNYSKVIAAILTRVTPTRLGREMAIATLHHDSKYLLAFIRAQW